MPNSKMSPKIEPPRKPGPIRSARLLTALAVAEITGLSTETLAQWRSQRRGIPFLKLSRNVVRYRESDVQQWLDERAVPVEAEFPARGVKK
jgi:predicted DNA-binding transcriptional regulator AlpA